MASPPIAHPTWIAQNGSRSGRAATATMAMPGASTRNPVRTNSASPVRRTQWSWIHVPAVHATVAAVTAMLPANVEAPRPSVTA